MSDSESEEDEYEIDRICGHIRKSDLITNGSELAYNEADLEKSACEYAFRVKWVGYEGEDTWQSYESLKDDKGTARRYAIKHHLQLFSNNQAMPVSNKYDTNNGYQVDEITGHCRISKLMRDGSDETPYDEESLLKSECKYAFKVTWVGFVGEDTWQSFESLGDYKKNAKDYGRRNGINLFPSKQKVFSTQEEIQRVHEIEEKFRLRNTSESSSVDSNPTLPILPSKGNRLIHKDSKSGEVNGKNRLDKVEEVIELSSEGEEAQKEVERKKKKKTMKDMMTEKDKKEAHSSSSSTAVVKHSVVRGLKIHHPNQGDKRDFKKEGRKSKIDSDDNEVEKKDMKRMKEEDKRKKEERAKKEEKKKKKEEEKKIRSSIDSSEENDESNALKKKIMKKPSENKKIEGARLIEDSRGESRKRQNKKKDESDEDSEVSPMKKMMKEPKGSQRSQNEDVKRSREIDERRKKSTNVVPPKDRMKKKNQNYSDSSDSSDSSDDDERWEMEKIISHVKVKEVRGGRDIEGKDDLNWKKINKSQLPIIFRVSYIRSVEHWDPIYKKGKCEWLTIEELDDLAELNRYAHQSSLNLPRGYASMMKQKKRVIDDDIFAAD